MDHYTFSLLLLQLFFISLIAGAMDAVVGGGGLVLFPGYMAVFPRTDVASVAGSAKATGVLGTSLAALRYARHVKLPWGALSCALVAAFIASGLGAKLLTLIDTSLMRMFLPWALLSVLLYVLKRPNLGQIHRPHVVGKNFYLRAIAIGAVLGFYDGFFGPGTGAFLVFAWVRFLGFDFLHASAASKAINVMCNIAALLVLGGHGHVLWEILWLTIPANILGSYLGSSVALHYGTGFIRKVFILIVFLLIMRTFYNAYWH